MKLTLLLFDVRLIVVIILFFSIIFYDFSKNKKLPLLSNKCFTIMLYFTATSLIFIVLRIFTTIYVNNFTPVLGRMSNQALYGTLIMIVVFLLWYIEILGNNQKRMKWTKVLLSIVPFAYSIIFLIFGDLDYEIHNQQLYVHGSMMIAFIITLLVYCAWIFGNTFRYKKNIQKEHRLAIRLGIIMLAGGSVTQIFDNSLIYSEVAITLMILFIYLTFENPKIYTDDETGTFNKLAFHLMLNEKKAAGTRLILVSVVVEDIKRVQTMVGHDQTNHILEMIGLVMTDSFQTDFHRNGRINRKHRRAAQFSLYHSRSNVMTFITEVPFDTIQKQLDQLDRQLKKPLPFSEYTIAIKTHIDVILTGHYEDQENCDEVYDMINYMAVHNEATSNTSIYLLNEDIIKHKLRYSTIENILRKAIEQDGFEMLYQPIYHTKNEQFLSSEALVRLKDNTTVGFISPEEFIPIAENKGFIMELGEIVFEKVCIFAREKQLQEIGIEYIEVNLSGIQCVHPDLPSQLHHIMKKYEIAPGFINLEITETAFVESGAMLQENMLQLRQMGCSFSMDDFGTGYSNLSRMAEVVYDLVKLDKSLIWPCFNEKASQENKKARAILENVIKLLQQLNVKIVAEGVETKEMATYLYDCGVTHLQGYYYSKPISEEAYIKFLTEVDKNIPA